MYLNMVPAEIRRRFENCRPVVDRVASTVRDTVLTYCENNGFAYIGRIKKLESLAEKIETGRYNKWSELDDLFACAVIVPTLLYEPDVLEFLGDVFLRVEVKKRGSTRKPPDTFRFEATRFYGRLRDSGAASSTDPRFGITFEVQVRSAFEHAWSVTTHAIYKSSKVDWREKRLAAQLKAAVEQLDSLVMAYEESSKTIVEHNWPEFVVRQTIVNRLSALSSRGVLPAEVMPTDWSRFAENFSALIRSSCSIPQHKQDEFVVAAVERFEADIVDSASNGSVPLSLSLLQYGLGVLTRAGVLTEPLARFCPLLTSELLALYPETARFSGKQFSFDG